MRLILIGLVTLLVGCTTPSVVVEPIPIKIPEALLLTPSPVPLMEQPAFERLSETERMIYLIQYAKSLTVIIGGYQQRVGAIRSLVEKASKTDQP